jgi:hypothetical protein
MHIKKLPYGGVIRLTHGVHEIQVRVIHNAIEQLSPYLFSAFEVLLTHPWVDL